MMPLALTAGKRCSGFSAANEARRAAWCPHDLTRQDSEPELDAATRLDESLPALWLHPPTRATCMPLDGRRLFESRFLREGAQHQNSVFELCPPVSERRVCMRSNVAVALAVITIAGCGRKVPEPVPHPPNPHISWEIKVGDQDNPDRTSVCKSDPRSECVVPATTP